MNLGFWEKLKRPIFALAPMANVTDASFRRIIAKYGKPDVTWTEFVSVEGLLSAGKEKLLQDLWYDESERPIVAQIFGGKPEKFYEVAKLCVELGFDGIDINMGCPDKGVEKSGGGAALIKDSRRAQQIILETKRGVADACLAEPRRTGSSIPVSVKTRLGYNKNEIESWVPALLETEPAVLTMHLRTRKEMSLVPAHWEEMPQIVALRDQYSPQTLILGNGDVKDLAEARQKVKETGCDGVMLGRAIFGNPCLFSASARAGRDGAEKNPNVPEKLRVAVEHTKLFIELFGDRKPFDLMKKHFKAYVNNFDGAKDLRVKMMEAKDADEIENLVNEFLK